MNTNAAKATTVTFFSYVDEISIDKINNIDHIVCKKKINFDFFKFTDLEDLKDYLLANPTVLARHLDIGISVESTQPACVECYYDHMSDLDDARYEGLEDPKPCGGLDCPVPDGCFFQDNDVMPIKCRVCFGRNFKLSIADRFKSKEFIDREEFAKIFAAEFKGTYDDLCKFLSPSTNVCEDLVDIVNDSWLNKAVQGLPKNEWLAAIEKYLVGIGAFFAVHRIVPLEFVPEKLAAPCDPIMRSFGANKSLFEPHLLPLIISYSGKITRF